MPIKKESDQFYSNMLICIKLLLAANDFKSNVATPLFKSDSDNAANGDVTTIQTFFWRINFNWIFFLRQKYRFPRFLGGGFKPSAFPVYDLEASDRSLVSNRHEKAPFFAFFGHS